MSRRAAWRPRPGETRQGRGGPEDTNFTPVTWDEAPPARPAFLTAEQVGRELGVGRTRVYELAASGLLPVVRLGRRLFFPRRAMEALEQSAVERALKAQARAALRDEGA
jgi:excisionase family DNA binding protein